MDDIMKLLVYCTYASLFQFILTTSCYYCWTWYVIN